MSIVGILLAAGRGYRFDPAGARNKLLQALPPDAAAPGEASRHASVLEASARNMLAALPRVVAVVRPKDEESAALLHGLGCEVSLCPQAALGMAASLVHGLRQAPQADGWVLALGDMPYVKPATIAALAHTVERGADIAAPIYQGRRGNPIAFGRRHLPLLLALEGDQGARTIVKNFPVNEVVVEDSGILLDIDTPSDLL
ncbi:nucleotidyltransferase family protein [Massilia sp. MB5]|uniref:nucleotidyltransferase family protein n=1 Tax=Massilia sp. MB5 TaxID=2919578 RepID=UPI001F0F454A|nr:nucleotidyltransferase family protein [Massilia sp. MB5]UMR32559.1 nucleotidyltransferase family protein [Massilia sp. MB5]